MEKQEVMDLLKSSKNSSEWNANCDTIKKAFNGGYPAWWYQEVVLSGFMDDTLGPGSSTIKISTY